MIIWVSALACKAAAEQIQKEADDARRFDTEALQILCVRTTGDAQVFRKRAYLQMHGKEYAVLLQGTKHSVLL